MHRKLRAGILLAIILVVLGFWVHHTYGTSSSSTKPTTHQTTANSQSTAASDFNKHQYSLTDPTSIWVIVNKQHPLQPKSYAPTDLVVPNVPLRVPHDSSMQMRKVTATALESLFAGAKADGLNLMLSSGYRSYQFQVSLYGGYVKTQGQATADKSSARPGYSEHQTGFAVDVEPLSGKCNVDPCFANLPEGKWVAANAYKYGFIVRYTPGDESVTGYEPEAWHIRYVGTALSNELHKEGVATLEQFFGISGGPNYAS